MQLRLELGLPVEQISPQRLEQRVVVSVAASVVGIYRHDELGVCVGAGQNRPRVIPG